MPKKQILGSIILIIILSFICMYIYNHYKVESTITVYSVSSDDTKEEIREYLEDKNNKYYIYDLDNIVVDFTDRKLELNRALDLKQVNMSFIFQKLTKKYSLNNETINFYQNGTFSLLECKLNDNTIYTFGPLDMDYKEGFCNSTPYLCSFTKTYYVIDINEHKNNKLSYLTLRSDSEVSTIEVNKEIVNGLEIGNYYQFKFGSNNKTVDTNIEDIFENNNVLSIDLLTDINNQVNENICN